MNPFEHNNRRASSKALDKKVRGAFRITTTGKRIPRKRKKYVYAVERATYRELLLLVSFYLAKQKSGKP